MSRLSAIGIPRRNSVAVRTLGLPLYGYLHLPYSRILHLGKRVWISRRHDDLRLRLGLWARVRLRRVLLAWARRYYNSWVSLSGLRLGEALSHARLRRGIRHISSLRITVWLRLGRMLAVGEALRTLGRPGVHGRQLQARESPEVVMFDGHRRGGRDC